MGASQQGSSGGPSRESSRDALLAWDLHDWNVRKVPLLADLDGERLEVRKHSAVVRDDPNSSEIIVLGTIGRRNTPIQNEDQVELMMWLLGLRRIDFVDAGFSGQGEQVFLVSDLPSGFMINSEMAGVPPTQGEFELVSVNHHDGGALRFDILPRGTWTSAIRPLFAPRGTDRLPTHALKDQALSRAYVRHNASRRGLPGKLAKELRLDRQGGGALGDL